MERGLTLVETREISLKLSPGEKMYADRWKIEFNGLRKSLVWVLGKRLLYFYIVSNHSGVYMGLETSKLFRETWWNVRGLTWDGLTPFRRSGNTPGVFLQQKSKWATASMRVSQYAMIGNIAVDLKHLPRRRLACHSVCYSVRCAASQARSASLQETADLWWTLANDDNTRLLRFSLSPVRTHRCRNSISWRDARVVHQF